MSATPATAFPASPAPAIEQLYWTTSKVGIGMSGRQDEQGVRAASPALAAAVPTTEYERFRETAFPAALRERLQKFQRSSDALYLKYYIDPTWGGVFLRIVPRRNDRPGRVFIHLLARLPATFSLPDAVQRWDAPFWCDTATNLADGEVRLPTLALTGLNPRPQTPLTIDPVCLQALIEAFLARTAMQRLVIVAEPTAVARLLLVLTQCLPRALFAGVSFATLDNDVVHADTTIVGTPKLPSVPTNTPVRVVDCTARRSSVPADDTPADIRSYAAFATREIFARDGRQLDEFLRAAQEAGCEDAPSLLALYAITDKLARGEPLASGDVLDVLRNPPVAAWLLQRQATFAGNILALAVEPGWARNAELVLAALRALRELPHGRVVAQTVAAAVVEQAQVVADGDPSALAPLLYILAAATPASTPGRAVDASLLGKLGTIVSRVVTHADKAGTDLAPLVRSHRDLFIAVVWDQANMGQWWVAEALVRCIPGYSPEEKVALLVALCIAVPDVSLRSEMEDRLVRSWPLAPAEGRAYVEIARDSSPQAMGLLGLAQKLAAAYLDGFTADDAASEQGRAALTRLKGWNVAVPLLVEWLRLAEVLTSPHFMRGSLEDLAAAVTALPSERVGRVAELLVGILARAVSGTATALYLAGLLDTLAVPLVRSRWVLFSQLLLATSQLDTNAARDDDFSAPYAPYVVFYLEHRTQVPNHVAAQIRGVVADWERGVCDRMAGRIRNQRPDLLPVWQQLLGEVRPTGGFLSRLR